MALPEFLSISRKQDVCRRDLNSDELLICVLYSVEDGLCCFVDCITILNSRS